MSCTLAIGSRSYSDSNARFSHWAARYVGIRYVPGGRAPEVGLDCWGLVLHYYRNIRRIPLQDIAFGQYIPILMENPNAVLPWNCRWERIEVPEEGCVVAMGYRDAPHHVGLWTAEPPGYIVHALVGLHVVAQTLVQVRRCGIRFLRYYRLATEGPLQSWGGVEP